jgi:predicted amidohydrolase YtcJ
MEKRTGEGMMTGRELITSLGLLAFISAVPAAADSRDDRDHCEEARDLTLVNGRIHTMDAQDSVVSTASIRNGKFETVGRSDHSSNDTCTHVIDLHGRTAVPGLIDNHNHFVLLSLRPGHDTRLETAASVSDVQNAIRARVPTVPLGAWITSMGGWNPLNLAERRFPTLTELDAAAPKNPVLLFQFFTGPGVTNSLGKAYFTAQGIAVDATGTIAANAPSLAALNALRAIQTLDDQKQGALDAMAYSAKVGVTTNVDMGGFVIPGTPYAQDSYEIDTLASWDPFTAYDALLALHQESRVSVRLRIFFLTMDTDPDVPLVTQRVLNDFKHFGDDMMRMSGIGEFASNWPLFGNPYPTNYTNALSIVAQRGWPFQQHSLSTPEDTFTLQTFQTVNETYPIADLHWSIAHVPTITSDNIAAAKALGVGLALHGFQYLVGSGGGPPYRSIVDSGIRAGAGSDSAQISTLDPWLMLYYMVTGRNGQGLLVNAGQTLTRAEALRLYTAANPWFFKEEGKLGSIEPGKLGDIVVISDDFFDEKRVPDEAIKRLQSVLTIVGGRVVYDALR